MLENCTEDPDQQVKLIEQRMRELHSIFSENKTKLGELEKQNRRRRKSESKPLYILDYIEYSLNITQSSLRICLFTGITSRYFIVYPSSI